MTQEIRHPEITVRLIGNDGNAFAVLGAVSGALRRAGVLKEERNEFMAEATSGGYITLLATCMKWVNVTGKDKPECVGKGYCPRCGEQALYQIDQLRGAPGNWETVRTVCRHCGHEIDWEGGEEDEPEEDMPDSDYWNDR